MHAAGDKDVDAAVDAAAKAYKEWRSTPGQVRAKYMNKMADLMEKDIEKFAQFETVCMGQPIAIAKKFVGGTPAIWRYYAGFCDKLGGESFPEDGDGKVKITQYMPYGVCAGIGSAVSLPRILMLMVLMSGCSGVEWYAAHGCQEDRSCYRRGQYVRF